MEGALEDDEVMKTTKGTLLMSWTVLSQTWVCPIVLAMLWTQHTKKGMPGQRLLFSSILCQTIRDAMDVLKMEDVFRRSTSEASEPAKTKRVKARSKSRRRKTFTTNPLIKTLTIIFVLLQVIIYTVQLNFFQLRWGHGSSLSYRARRCLDWAGRHECRTPQDTWQLMLELSSTGVSPITPPSHYRSLSTWPRSRSTDTFVPSSFVRLSPASLLSAVVQGGMDP